MNDMHLKSSITELLNQTHNESFLQAVLRFFQDALAQKETSVWHTLSKREQQEVLDAYLESEDDANLIAKETVISRLK